MDTRIKYFLFFFLALSLSGCGTKTLRQGAFQQAQWETKAVVKNLQENKNQSLSIDVFAIKSERIRFEITALMGFNVASIVMSPSEISYAIYPQKTFFYGKNSERAFAKVLGMPLHPMNLANIAFDEPIRGAGWKCVLDSAGMIEKCDNSRRSLVVQWSDRIEGKKKVVITGPQFEMQWQFNAPKTEVQFKPDLFTLKQPAGFKAIQLN